MRVMRFFVIIIIFSSSFISCKPDNRIDMFEGWRFKVDDSAVYKNPSFNDASWDSITLPKILAKENIRKTVWLRKSFFVPAELKDKDLALEIGKIWDTDNTYINGIKIGSSGSDFPDFFSLWNYDRYYIIPEGVLRYGETNVISIRVFSNCISFFSGSPFIAELRSVRTYNFFQRLIAEYIVIGLTLLSIYFGINSLVQYITYREFKIPLYYSICALLIGIMSVEFYLPDLAGITYVTKDNLFYTILTLVISFFYFLLENLLYTRNRLFQVLLIFSMIITIIISLTATDTDPIQNWRIIVIGSLTFLCYVLCGILLFRFFMKREVTKEIIILTIGYLINMGCVFHDIFMMEGVIIPATFLIPIAFNIQYVCFGMVLSIRSSEMYVAKIVAEQSRDHYLNEINLAKKIQDQLIPSTAPADYIYSLYKPMESVGGDFYDFIRFDNSDNIGIFISDVSGHGLPAAFITSMLKTTILQSGSRKDNPAELLNYINNVLYGQTAGNFITAFYGIYNPAEKTIRYANAGHPQPYLITDENIFQLQKGTSTAIALFPHSLLSESGKTYVNFEKKLQSNSKLLFFTDGLTETTPVNNYKLSFDSADMIEFFIENRMHPCRMFIEGLYRKLVKHRRSDSFEDDICLICIDVQ